jgi:hypothetical protein
LIVIGCTHIEKFSLWDNVHSRLKSILKDYWQNKQQSDQCKIPSDGVPIGSGTFATILGGITIWYPWSNKSYANLEDSACTLHSTSVVLLLNSYLWIFRKHSFRIATYQRLRSRFM